MIPRVLLLLLLVVPACSAGERGVVSMTGGNRFDPSTATVRVGETLRLVNDSSQAHTVTAYEDSLPEGIDYFSSGGFEDEQSARDGVAQGLIDPGESFEVTFSAPGRVRYFCLPHEAVGMTGVIVIEQANAD